MALPDYHQIIGSVGLLSYTALFYSLLFLIAVVFLLEYVKTLDGNSPAEKYLFQNTIEMLKNQENILDFIKAKVDEFKKTGIETFKVKVLFQPQYVFTSNVENITRIRSIEFILIKNTKIIPNFIYYY